MINQPNLEEVRELFEKSRNSQRKRAIRIFQDDSYEGPQACLNVIQPESYVRPHFRYQDESIIFYNGRLCSLLFNNHGEITDKFVLSKETPYLFLPKGTFQSVVSLEKDSAIWMIIQGPHNPEKFSEYLPESPDEKGDH